VDIAKICDALGNETRYQIMKSLKDRAIATCCKRIEYYENGITVGDVVNITGLAQSTISQHLAVLVNAGILYKEKRGPWTCFFLNKDVIREFIEELNQVLK
jgi:DNA-binding transcriptional ArsR family regulator